MLKANRLMIDDWVMMNGSAYQVMELKKKGVIKLYDNFKGSIIPVNTNTDWIEEFLYPIKLTKDILLKNGFVDKGKYLELAFWDGNPESITETHIIEHDEYEGISWWLFDNEFKIMDVHRLQHVLKECDIEKDIVI